MHHLNSTSDATGSTLQCVRYHMEQVTKKSGVKNHFFVFPDWSLVCWEVFRNELPLLLQPPREPDLHLHLQVPQQDVSQLAGFSFADREAGALLPEQFESIWTKTIPSWQWISSPVSILWSLGFGTWFQQHGVRLLSFFEHDRRGNWEFQEGADALFQGQPCEDNNLHWISLCIGISDRWSMFVI